MVKKNWKKRVTGTMRQKGKSFVISPSSQKLKSKLHKAAGVKGSANRQLYGGDFLNAGMLAAEKKLSGIPKVHNIRAMVRSIEMTGTPFSETDVLQQLKRAGWKITGETKDLVRQVYTEEVFGKESVDKMQPILKNWNKRAIPRKDTSLDEYT